MGKPARERFEWTWVLRPTDQVTTCVLLGIAWSWIATLLVRDGWLEMPVEPVRADPRRAAWAGNETALPATNLVTFELDINAAEWPEWALLPGIGETLAKRIVAHRARIGGFQSIDDVGRVRGIGPKSLTRFRPFLIRRSDFLVSSPSAPNERPPWNSSSPASSLPRETSRKPLPP